MFEPKMKDFWLKGTAALSMLGEGVSTGVLFAPKIPDLSRLCLLSRWKTWRLQ
jgi:hypothetical protein